MSGALNFCNVSNTILFSFFYVIDIETQVALIMNTSSSSLAGRGFYAKSNGVKYSLYAQRHDWCKIFPLGIKAIFAILRQSVHDPYRPVKSPAFCGSLTHWPGSSHAHPQAIVNLTIDNIPTAIGNSSRDAIRTLFSSKSGRVGFSSLFEVLITLILTATEALLKQRNHR